MTSFVTIDFSNGYVLAAEDSLVQAKKLIRFFENHNIRYKVQKNGAEALKEALVEKPMLIISDIVMPEMDGYEFCSAVKAHASLNDVPFILLTSLSDPLDIIRGLQAGADNFITKPYDESYLMTRINYLLTNRFVRQHGAGDMTIEIEFQNERFLINSDKKQILDLLLSVYEAAVFRNTQLIEAQQQLQKLNEELKTANMELDAFARTVSHDLRSPLSGIIGFTQLTLDDHSDHLAPDIIENLTWSLSTAEKMANLITDLLNYSRSGRAEVVRKPMNMSEMAREIMRDILATNAKVEVKFMITGDFVVNGDPALMRIVLTNLLGNAVKYAGKNPEPAVVFGSETAVDQTIYFVKDNGVGFDMAEAAKLFQPFVRLESGLAFPGTGVGLNTVKRIIGRHGGEVWAEAEPGKGATFFFSLP